MLQPRWAQAPQVQTQEKPQPKWMQAPPVEPQAPAPNGSGMGPVNPMVAMGQEAQARGAGVQQNPNPTSFLQPDPLAPSDPTQRADYEARKYQRMIDEANTAQSGNNPATRNMFTDAVRFVEAPVAGLTGGGLEGWAKTTSEDPLLGANEAVNFISPVDEFGRASYGFGQAVGGAATGDMDKAVEGLQQFSTEGSYAAMQALPGSMTLKGLTGPARMAPTTMAQAEKAAVAASRAPSLKAPSRAPKRAPPPATPDNVVPFSAPAQPSGPGIVGRNMDRIIGGGVGAVVGGAGDAYAADGDGNGDGGPLNATTGAAIGIFGPRALASAGSRGFRAAARAARSPGARAAFDERVAARAVRKGLVSGGLKTEQDALAAARARFGDKPAAVADLTQDSVGTATGLSRLPGATGEAARARGEDLLQTQPGRVFGDISGTTGIDPASVTQSIDDAIRAASEEISPAYEALFDANKGVNSERLMQLADDPIVGPYVRRAIQASESLQTTAGQTASNARIWDLVKRGLDRTIESQKRAGGQAAYELEQARAAIKEELDALMPGYKAVRDGADAPRMRDARKKGAQVMSGAVSVESVKKLASSLTGRPLTAMQAGMIEKIVPGVERGKNIQALASGRTERVLEAAFGPDVARQLVARIRSDVAIVENARRINPNVGSVTSQANMGGGEGAMATAANLWRMGTAPVQTALTAMSKSGSYTKAQRDLMGQMLLEGPSPENLARIYRSKTRGGAPTRGSTPKRPLPGQTSNASPTVTGALVGGGLGYVASDGDPTATLAGAVGVGGIGALAGKMAKGGKAPRKPAPAPKAPPRAPMAAQSASTVGEPAIRTQPGYGSFTRGNAEIEYKIHDGGKVEIETMWVDPQHRRNGEASRALDAFLRQVDQNGSEVRLTVDAFPRVGPYRKAPSNNQLKRFYEAKGFEPVESGSLTMVRRPSSTLKPPATSVSAMPESMRLASARLKDGSYQDVVADVFTDNGVVVVSPSWPTNAGDDLSNALVNRSNELRSPRKGFKVVDDQYSPKAAFEPSAKWSSQNPQEMADLTKQVADRFIGLSRNGDAHVLALTDEVDLNSLASYLEANIPSSKQLVATRDGGEIAIVSKRWLRENEGRFAAPTWEPLYPSYNQGKGLRPAPADWAKPPKKPN